MTKSNRSLGFGIVEVILVVVLLAVVGLIGFRMWQSNNSGPANENTEQSEQAQQDDAPQVNNEEDLEKADEALDNTNVEGDSSAQLNEETNF